MLVLDMFPSLLRRRQVHRALFNAWPETNARQAVVPTSGAQPKRLGTRSWRPRSGRIGDPLGGGELRLGDALVRSIWLTYA